MMSTTLSAGRKMGVGHISMSTLGGHADIKLVTC